MSNWRDHQQFDQVPAQNTRSGLMIEVYSQYMIERDSVRFKLVAGIHSRDNEIRKPSTPVDVAHMLRGFDRDIHAYQIGADL